MDSNSTPLLDATIRASEPFPQPRFSQGSSSHAAGKLPKASPEPSSSTDKATQDHHDRLQPPEGGMFWKRFLIVHYRQQRTIATLTKELTRSHKKVKKAKHHRSKQFRDLRQELHMALVSVYRLRKQNMKYRRILSVAVGKYPLGETFVDEKDQILSPGEEESESDGIDEMGWNQSETSESSEESDDGSENEASTDSDELFDPAELLA